jgi:murein tripeptide amidase MpaA
MNNKASLILLSLLVLLANSVFAETTIYTQIRVWLETEEERFRLHSLYADIIYETDEYADVAADQEMLNIIRLESFKTDIIHQDMTAFYQSRLDPDKMMGGYRTLSEIYDYIDAVIAAHPDIVSAKQDFGHTLEDRPMYAIKVSDNPNIDEDEPELMLTGAIHAREVITPALLIYYIDYLVDNYGTDGRVTYLVDNREIWFVLVVNPDGYYHNEVIAPNGGGMWRKNRRDNGDGSFGVDLNRNFGYEWGYNDIGSSPSPISEVYRGTGPFSEPAIQNMRDFTIAHEFDIIVYYHAFGEFIIWPWAYNTTATPDDNIFRPIAVYINELNGYSASGLAGANGMSYDWDYGEQTLKDKCFSYIIEVGSDGDGFWPAPGRIPVLVEQNLESNLFLTGIAGNLESVFAPVAPTLILDDRVPGSEYTVEWTHEDISNPALLFELYENSLEKNITDPGENLDAYENNDFEVSTERYYSSPSSFYSGAQDFKDYYIQSNLPIEVNQDDILTFKTYYDIQAHLDYAYVEISTDGTNFTTIEGNITTTANPYGNNRGHGITGSSGGWVEAQFDLSDYGGQEVYVRLSYETDYYILGEGFYVDDIYPVNRYTEEIIYSNLTENSITMYDKSPSYYDYFVRALDEQGQWSEFSDGARTYAKPPYICGDTDGNEVVDLLDIVFMIDNKFKDGPLPDPIESADVNNDGTFDILDIVHMIDFKFKECPPGAGEGTCPPPNCP